VRLKAKSLPAVTVFGGAIRPDEWIETSTKEIAREGLRVGREIVPLGELFQLDGDPADGCLEIEGDLRSVRELGRGMYDGRLVVRGDVGPYLGAELEGGVIELAGSAGPGAGVAMTGGQLRIVGSAGDHLGGAWPGRHSGLNRGVILVHGSVGDFAGESMRRGLIAIAGDSGAGLGHAMIAGTIILIGGPGYGVGQGMKRGSIVLLNPRQGRFENPGFPFAVRSPASWLLPYRDDLNRRGFGVPELERLPASTPFDRYNGDVRYSGQGEILLRAAE
jgi:formylmethanofuran dehydrogenase subunit C